MRGARIARGRANNASSRARDGEGEGCDGGLRAR